MNERRFLLWFVLIITALFVWMIRAFIPALLLAAIFSGLLRPAFRWLLPRMGGRRSLTAATLLVAVTLLVVLPVVAFLGVVAAQALEFSETARPWLAEQVQQRGTIADRLIERFPALEPLRPYEDQIRSRGAEIAGKVGGWLAKSLSAVAGGTVAFFFHLFVMLYAMFTFLIDDHAMVSRILSYLPLPEQDKKRLLALFLSVSRSMLKGTFIVGIVQGALGAASFALAGVEGWALWGTVMAASSVIPGIGTAMVWVPVVAYLMISGSWFAAIGVGIWCAAVVGSIDNVLRPRLVGRETSMPPLLIFLATLGGLAMFGPVGILFGPILAAVFQSVWEMYGHALTGGAPARAS